MSKKNYLVKMEVICDVLVIGAESEEKAYEYAIAQVTVGDCVINGAEIEEVPDDQVASERRHANAVSEDKP
jgi:hypothetical protein